MGSPRTLALAAGLVAGLGGCTERAIDDGRAEAIGTTCAQYCPTFQTCNRVPLWDSVEACVDACEDDLESAAGDRCFDPQVADLQCIGSLSCDEFARRQGVADVFGDDYPCKPEAVAHLQCQLDG